MSHVNLLDTLTERETEVYALLLLGLNRQQIADDLTVSLSTAKYHMENIYKKLNVRTRSAAVAYHENLRRAGLLKEDTPVSFSSGNSWTEVEIREAASALIAHNLGDRKVVNQIVTDLLMILEGRL